MTKDEFIDLNVIDKINYINAELKTGKRVPQIRKDIGVSEEYIQKFMKDNNYKYNQKLKQYIPTTENTTITTTNSTTETTTNSTTMDLELSEVNKDTNALLSIENANTLDYLTNNMNILIDIIEGLEKDNFPKKEELRKDLLDLSNIHRDFLENIKALIESL